MTDRPIIAGALDYAATLEIVTLCVLIAGLVLIMFMMRNHVTRATLNAAVGPLAEKVHHESNLIEGLSKVVGSHETRLDELSRRQEQNVGKGEMDAVVHAVKNTSQGILGVNTRIENLGNSLKGEIQRVDAAVGRLVDHMLEDKRQNR